MVEKLPKLTKRQFTVLFCIHAGLLDTARRGPRQVIHLGCDRKVYEVCSRGTFKTLVDLGLLSASRDPARWFDSWKIRITVLGKEVLGV